MTLRPAHPGQHRRPRRLPSRPARLVAAGAAAVALPCALAGTALAYWPAGGSGAGTASSSAGAAALTTTATVATGSLLVPGGGAVALSLTVDNASGSAVQVTGLALDTTRSIGISGAKGTCTATALSVAAPGGWAGLSVPAHGTTGATTIAGAVSMGTGADSGCQGATFTIPVTLTGHN